MQCDIIDTSSRYFHVFNPSETSFVLSHFFMDLKQKDSTSKSAQGKGGTKCQITISKFFKKDGNVENQNSKKSQTHDVDKNQVKKN